MSHHQNDFSFSLNLAKELDGDTKHVPDPENHDVELQRVDESQLSESSDDGLGLEDELLCSSATTDEGKRDSGLSGLRSRTDPSEATKIKPQLSKRKKARKFGHDAKAKTKRFLHIDNANDRKDKEVDAEDEDNPYAELDNPAFDPTQLTGKKRLTVGGTADKAMGMLYTSAKAVIHPRSTVKGKAADKVAITDRPYLSQENDLEYLQAHEDLTKARSSQASGVDTDSEGERNVQASKDKVESLDQLRASRKVAYITSRHMHRVQVTPNVNLEPPLKANYYILDKETGERKFDWLQYGYALNRYYLKDLAINHAGDVDFTSQPPFDKEVMLRYIERIVIASAPWQSWFMSLRELYLWENPARTRKWAIIWFFVWYMDYCMTFTLAYVPFIVLKNKYAPKKAEDMRASYQRAMDGSTRSFRFQELINRHGSDKWMDPLTEAAGPTIQLQVADLADFLEILQNFYDWASPKRTWATLFWFATALVIGVLTPAGYSMKIVWMFCLLMFFLGRPIASKHPQYRHVVNALKWIFWEIPTDAQWSMMHLRNKAQETRAKLIEREIEKTYTADLEHPTEQTFVGSMDIGKHARTESVAESDADVDSDGDSWHTADSSADIIGSLDLVAFRCRIGSHSGSLIIYSDGLRFVRSAPLSSIRRELWRRPWQELVDMEKVSLKTAVGKLVGTQGLRFGFTDGTHVDVQAMKQRDRCFNCVIGFSGLLFMPADLPTMPDRGDYCVADGAGGQGPFE